MKTVGATHEMVSDEPNRPAEDENAIEHANLRISTVSPDITE